MQNLFEADESVLIQCKPKFKDIFWYNSFIVAWRIIAIVVLGYIYLSAHHSLFKSIDPASHIFIYEVMGIIIVALILIFAINYVYTLLYTLNAEYIITNKKIYLRSGIININKKIILYRSVADLVLNQNFLQRLYRLGSLQIDEYTGASRNNTTKHTINGLKIDQLEEILKLINQNVQNARNVIS